MYVLEIHFTNNGLAFRNSLLPSSGRTQLVDQGHDGEVAEKAE